MKVKLINGSEDPEELVCTAARNDYREDGIIGNSFGELMAEIEPDDDHLNEVGNEQAEGPVNKRNWAELREERIPFEVQVEARKRTLIDHLIDNGHWGPFEHPQAVIAVEGVTRVVTHQMVRHRHFSYDQQSLRYVSIEDVEVVDDQFRVPEFGEAEEAVDREGVHEIEDVTEVKDIYGNAYDRAMREYQALRDRGVPKEKARLVLPMGIKTNIVMSGNARAWMHILNVRTKADVQGETRECADAIFEELKEWMPYTMQKYDEDVLPLKLNP